ncbi:cache domain-containing sensor histidine kinase [Paenibacillus sp. SAF-054]|uniref:cache domain-containing sensor histidine kinase n=1 Tax=unclassified Paenibacillus TaxID=185978 RepID=UPI003F81807F
MSFFRKLSIRYQFIVIGLVIIAIIPVVVLGVYRQSSKFIIEQNTQYNEELISMMKQRISSNYANISELMINLGYDATVQNLLAESDNLRIYELSKKVQGLMSVIKSTYPNIIDIAIVSNHGKLISMKGGIRQTDAVGAGIGSDGTVHYAGFVPGDMVNERDHFLFGMNIFSSGSKIAYGEKAGFIVLALDVQDINKEFQKFPRLAGTSFYLYDAQELVYSNTEPGAKQQEEIRAVLRSGKPSEPVKTIKSSRYIIQVHALPEIRGKIVTVTPISILMKGLDRLKRTSYTLAAVMLLLIFFLYSIMKMNVLKPLSLLMSFMKRLKTQNLDALHSRVHLQGYAEIEVISNEFNTMLERIHGLTHQLIETNSELYESELEKQRIEFAYLQSQINPHFLSNTLDTIKGIAIVEGSKATYEMAGALSRMLRYSIKGGDEVPLGEELQIVSSYMKIHQLRFSGRIQYEQDCPEELQGLAVPKMILQPIVENAINHGLESIGKGGVIRVEARQNDAGELGIMISDNGIGIRPERLTKLRQILQSEDALLSEHIGLRNVHNRIRLKYGEPYGITLASEPGQGTKVHIRLPAKPVRVPEMLLGPAADARQDFKQ